MLNFKNGVCILPAPIVPLFSLPLSLSTPLSRPPVLTLFRALPLNSPFAAAARSRDHRVHRLRGNKGNLLPAG